MMYNYNTLFPPSPIFCSPVPMVPLSITQPITSIPQEAIQNTLICQNGGNTSNEPKINQTNNNVPVPQFQRPASQATSVKAEPGSAMGSIASASVANKVGAFRLLLLVNRQTFCLFCLKTNYTFVISAGNV